MQIEQVKQYHDILCDELNVLEARQVIETEKGDLEIIYNRKDREFRLMFNHERIENSRILNHWIENWDEINRR